MTDKISKIIALRRIVLSKKQFVLHYFFVLILPILIILIVQAFIHDKSINGETVKSIKSTTLKIATYFSIAIAIVQNMKLKMTEKFSELTTNQFEQICQLIAHEMHWIIESKGEGFMVFSTPEKWYKCGTLITVIKDEDLVLFNSICKLHKSPAFFSFGQNARNYKVLKQAFSQ